MVIWSYLVETVKHIKAVLMEEIVGHQRSDFFIILFYNYFYYFCTCQAMSELSCWQIVQIVNTNPIFVFKCSRREAFIVNLCVFFMQNLCMTVLTSRVTFTPLTFCVLRDLKFPLNHNFKQLNSIGGNLILKVKWKVRWNWCHFLL